MEVDRASVEQLAIGYKREPVDPFNFILSMHFVKVRIVCGATFHCSAAPSFVLAFGWRIGSAAQAVKVSTNVFHRGTSLGFWGRGLSFRAKHPFSYPGFDLASGPSYLRARDVDVVHPPCIIQTRGNRQEKY